MRVNLEFTGGLPDNRVYEELGYGSGEELH